MSEARSCRKPALIRARCGRKVWGMEILLISLLRKYSIFSVFCKHHVNRKPHVSILTASVNLSYISNIISQKLGIKNSISISIEQ